MRLVILRILGSISSIFVALCCLGAPAVIAALSAVGAGFLINDAVQFGDLAYQRGWLAHFGIGDNNG